ncbi:phosphoserine aminotransferase [Chloropicon primus]|uniref:Phosphoserine aminotransferase n=1 Tax=Chloropicon primus TaxID=1764295 RepID=A0A5B8MYB7_9CHLO|nr:phosphoserine aminotransferase [Chloropicon primus]UPR04315.1 phosphoserine aminotransferase [Chloropicon primus]|eukprot:QDZ25106.1 phosphoserine aminotransferase [Chloropicon primus]
MSQVNPLTRNARRTTNTMKKVNKVVGVKPTSSSTMTMKTRKVKKGAAGRGCGGGTRTRALGDMGVGTERLVNFSAGPACVYEDVLVKAQEDLLNFEKNGLSVMEMSHRGKAFTRIIEEAEADLRELLGVPDEYSVLFMQGGATAQFAAVPYNLGWSDDVTDVGFRPRADYLTTGSWSKKALAEAKKVGVDANVVATGDNKSIPLDAAAWDVNADSGKKSKYFHVCANETIQGVELKGLSPRSVLDEAAGGIYQGVPLVADMSSNFCSKPVKVSDYGVIYAGAQKNVGPAGVTIVIVRKDLLGKVREGTPTMLDWTIMDENSSLYNTPPCFSIYMCGLVFKHLLSLGGLDKVEQINKAKCGLLYDTIKQSQGYYDCPVDPKVRSAMNVPFTIPENPDLEKVFLQEAEANGLINLKGHRSVGGMRASIYNAMPLEGVEKLVSFMKDFQAKH